MLTAQINNRQFSFKLIHNELMLMFIINLCEANASNVNLSDANSANLTFTVMLIVNNYKLTSEMFHELLEPSWMA